MNELLVMIGPSGSGKSTYAEDFARDHEGYVIVSSDKIRKEFWGSEDDQRDGKTVFDEVLRQIGMHLVVGESVIVDAMNLRVRWRKKLLKYFKNYDIMFNCVVMMTQEETCIARQDGRERKVPEEVIRAQFKRFQLPDLTEGWDHIHYIEEL